MTITQPVYGGLYVDDLVIYMSGDCTENVEETIQTNINTISERADKLGFKLSPSKTVCVHFCRLRSRHTNPNLNINGNPIVVQPVVKFLSLTFDPKLTWLSHITDLETKAKKSLNIVRCMSNINWGSDRGVLLKMSMSLVLSKIDHGSFIYGCARRSRLRKLDSIHCTGLRISIGAFRTSPLHSVCCDAGIPPQSIRREQLLLNYVRKIRTLPQHPVYPCLFQNELVEVYESRTTIIRPVGIRFRELMRRLELTLPDVFPLRVCEIQPWTITTPEIRNDLTHYFKNEDNSMEIKNKFNEVLGDYQGALQIYTDGSKASMGVGCAFATMGQTHMWTLPYASSVYTAELYSIWQALRFSEHSEQRTILIITDSLSSLQAITNSFSKDPLVQMILSLLSWLPQVNKNVSFLWVPSHFGIIGNELADKAARQSADKQSIDNISIRHHNLRLVFEEAIHRTWQMEWKVTESKLKIVKPDVKKWTVSYKLPRRESVTHTIKNWTHPSYVIPYA